LLDALSHVAYVDNRQVVAIDARRTLALHASDGRRFVAEGAAGAERALR
jgi:hypothetical protein